MNKMPTAQATADYLIWLAANENRDEPEYLTPLQLQKLLFYVQGWSWAEFGRPFFSDEIQAWKAGPVVPSVYDRYKDQGRNLPIISESTPHIPELSDEERAHIHAVWDAYKNYSGIALSEISHREAAYRESYTPQDASGRCKVRIDESLIRRDFSGRAATVLARVSSKREKLRAYAAAKTRDLVGRDAF